MSREPRALRTAALTHPGRVRDHNEDAFAVSPAGDLVIVADGMGGANAGAAAARIVVEVLPRMIAGRTAGLAADALATAVRDAIVDLGAHVHERSASRPGIAGMGATVVLGLVRGDRLLVAHMGDSRAYLFRAGELRRLTDDHSVLEILLRRGDVTPDKMKDHPARGRLSRYVGMDGLVYPDVRSVGLERGDRLLLCTDGLTGMLHDAAVAQVLGGGADLEAQCRSLIDAANTAGGRDNITVLLAEWPGKAGVEAAIHV